ncbi:MAG TPA: cytochrome C oxidase subunit IV family protein [Flavobacteriaceae bacterium]|nr:cytochrome C oxidase subunit IV family protein [Flavobacteriaceae bacterium]
MAQEYNLAIFRGRLKFKDNRSKIWGVFIFLSILTAIEVGLGMARPEALVNTKWFQFIPILTMTPLTFIFIILTIIKAYYITWDFMHMRDEVKFLRRLIVWSAVFFIIYFVVLILLEGQYMYEVLTDGLIKFDF